MKHFIDTEIYNNKPNIVKVFQHGDKAGYILDPSEETLNFINKQRKMKTFIGVKMIAAIAMTLGAYNEYRGWKQPEGEDAEKEGYLVEYLGNDDLNHPDHANYVSWSPKEVFEASYYPIEDELKSLVQMLKDL